MFYKNELLSICGSIIKTTNPISMKFSTKMAYTPGSDVGLFPFRYLVRYQDGGHLSDVNTCQISAYHS